MPRRRVALLSEHASPVALLGSVDAGGQNVYVDEVSRRLPTLGYGVDIFTRRDDRQAPEVVEWAPGVRVVNVQAGPANWVFKDGLWPYMPAFRDGIRDFMERDGGRYDLIHGNFWMSGWVAVALKEQLIVPMVQIFHATGKTKRRHQREADSSPPERIRVELDIVREAEAVIAQCPAEETELVEDYAAAPQKVHVIPSAVTVDQFSPEDRLDCRRRLGLDPDDLVVAYIGRMVPRKDVRNVVRAVALLVKNTDLPVKLLLVGGETPEPDPKRTPEIGELMRLAVELDIVDRLIFTGKRQPETLRYYYGAADICVTTPWYEPFGLTPLEAMACARPIIGSDVGGISFTIADGETGFLVPPRDPGALADHLRTLLSDPDLRREMGSAGRARVERYFTWETVARRTAALYETVLGQYARHQPSEGNEDGLSPVSQPAEALHASG